METPYRSPARALSPPPDPWADLRKSRRLGWLTFFGFAPAAMAVSGVSTLLFGQQATNAYFLWIGAPFLIAAAFAQMNAAYRACPSCGRTFAVRALYGNPFTRSCLHCGAKIGAPLKRP